MTEIRREFSPSPIAPALAREALDGWLGAMVGEDSADAVRTVATELVSNAVRHGGLEDADKIVVLGDIDDVHDIVRIEIEQPTAMNGAMVAGPASSPNDILESGMGLLIVEALTNHWGVDKGPPGVVWFEVDR